MYLKYTRKFMLNLKVVFSLKMFYPTIKRFYSNDISQKSRSLFLNMNNFCLRKTNVDHVALKFACIQSNVCFSINYRVRTVFKIRIQTFNFLKNGQTNYNKILTHNRLMYKIAIYSIKSPFASITASMRPRNLEQALTFWAFFMALNSFLIRLINSSFVLHRILLVHLSIAPHTKKYIGFRSGEFGGQT